MAENTIIPADTDKILFVEDLIKYTTDVEVQYPNFRAASYRERVHNGFNLTVLNAIIFLEDTMKHEHEKLCKRMMKDDALTAGTFIELSNYFQHQLSTESFDLEKFLSFCVHMTTLAAFLHFEKITGAPMFAFNVINIVLRKYDMTTERWDTLNRIAERYQSMGRAGKNLTCPKIFASDEEIPKYFVYRNPVQNADVNYENWVSNKLTTEKQNYLAAKVGKFEKSQIHYFQEKEQTCMFKDLYNPENVDILSNSQTHQSTSNMVKAVMTGAEIIKTRVTRFTQSKNKQYDSAL